jgi:hypothetical protein
MLYARSTPSRFPPSAIYPNPLDPDLTAAKRVVDHLRKVILAAEKLGLKKREHLHRARLDQERR